MFKRARDVLEHAGEWGATAQDGFGARITLKSTDVRDGLELKRDESLQPKQVRDVFEKIVVLCPDHHADFDYGMIEVDPETLEITHGYDTDIDGSELQVESSHNLKTNFFEYHNEQISNI